MVAFACSTRDHAVSEDYDERAYNGGGENVANDLAEPCVLVVRLIKILHWTLPADGLLVRSAAILPTCEYKDREHSSNYQHPMLNGQAVNIIIDDKPIEKPLHIDPRYR